MANISNSAKYDTYYDMYRHHFKEKWGEIKPPTSQKGLYEINYAIINPALQEVLFGQLPELARIRKDYEIGKRNTAQKEALMEACAFLSAYRDIFYQPFLEILAKSSDKTNKKQYPVLKETLDRINTEVTRTCGKMAVKHLELQVKGVNMIEGANMTRTTGFTFPGNHIAYPNRVHNPTGNKYGPRNNNVANNRSEGSNNSWNKLSNSNLNNYAT